MADDDYVSPPISPSQAPSLLDHAICISPDGDLLLEAECEYITNYQKELRTFVWRVSKDAMSSSSPLIKSILAGNPSNIGVIRSSLFPQDLDVLHIHFEPFGGEICWHPPEGLNRDAITTICEILHSKASQMDNLPPHVLANIAAHAYGLGCIPAMVPAFRISLMQEPVLPRLVKYAPNAQPSMVPPGLEESIPFLTLAYVFADPPAFRFFSRTYMSMRHLGSHSGLHPSDKGIYQFDCHIAKALQFFNQGMHTIFSETNGCNSGSSDKTCGELALGVLVKTVKEKFGSCDILLAERMSFTTDKDTVRGLAKLLHSVAVSVTERCKELHKGKKMAHRCNWLLEYGEKVADLAWAVEKGFDGFDLEDFRPGRQNPRLINLLDPVGTAANALGPIEESLNAKYNKTILKDGKRDPELTPRFQIDGWRLWQFVRGARTPPRAGLLSRSGTMASFGSSQRRGS